MILIRSVVVAFLFIASGFAISADAPEFDGGYIKTTGGGFVEVKAKQPGYTQISRGGMSISALINSPQIYYVVSKEGIQSIDKSKFKGIAIRGEKKIENFSLHPLVEKKLSENEGLFENHGPASNASTLYSA
jgi:hypothetical protein